MTGVKGKRWLTSEQIVELDKSGLVEIGSHTVWHPYLKRVAKDRQWQELNDSKIYLDKLLNKSINIICYPFGMYNQQIEDLAKQAGYEAGLTFDQDAWQNPNNLFELKRISVYPGLDVIKFLEKLENGTSLSP
jgi:peptidoglycan/xylan/chitin deacetylase (PgdA/CDA1 family)